MRDIDTTDSTARRTVRTMLALAAGLLVTAAPAAAAPRIAHTSSACAPTTTIDWSSACWRPYGSTSPFNQPVPAAPALTPDSSAVVAAVLKTGTPNNFQAGPTVGYEAVYYTDPAAPVSVIHCTEPWGTCAVEGARLHIPVKAQPAPNQDHHMVLIDRPSGTEYDLWMAPAPKPGGGTMNVNWGGRASVTGDGLHSNSNAANFGGLAGVVRASELTAGHIDHALVLSVSCDNGTFVWPAVQSDTRCADGAGPAMGAHLQLNMTGAAINALSVPAWKKTVLHAFATYGAYVEDTGNTPWAIKFEGGTTYTSMGQVDPWMAIAKSGAWNYWAPDNDYVGNMGAGVPWSQLRVIAPCVAERTC